MKPIKETTFIEAVAAAIQHEKDKFDFFLKTVDEIKNDVSKEFFESLAEDVESNIKVIEDLYKELQGTKTFPNLKQLGQVQRFHSTTIQKLMNKLDKVTKEDVKGSVDKAVELLLKEGDDIRNFYVKIKEKFIDPKIALLFNTLANFNEEKRLLIEYHLMSVKQAEPVKKDYYWEDEKLMKEANSTGIKEKSVNKVPSKKKATIAPAKKKAVAKKKAKAK